MYAPTKNLNFGVAVEALKEGRRISRAGWNGKGMFIFMQVPSEIPMGVVPKMQSLPQSVKDEFQRRFDNRKEDSPVLNSINYKNQLVMVCPDNTIYGWAASPSDVLEEDWCILD